ncbi:MAG: ATP-binding cassette domain-containing protein [Eggerthellaceae bacterium]|jgi:energy-coupling factor transporter ATPase
MTDSSPLITCADAWYRYPGTTEEAWAVRGASFTLHAGEHMAIVGGNGSGKSTLAKLACGLLIPDRGQVKVRGLDTQDAKSLVTIHQQCGYVFQNPDDQLVESLVVDEVAFGPANLGLSADEITARVQEALSAVGLADRAHDEVATLSGGQKQRLAIAGVLALHPHVIILDEATTMLDARGRRDLATVLARLKAQGIALVSITHSMDEAVAADTMAALVKGRIVAQDRPENLFERDDLIECLELGIPHTVALQRAFSEMGMALPFCRTVDEAAQAVLEHTGRSAR